MYWHLAASSGALEDDMDINNVHHLQLSIITC